MRYKLIAPLALVILFAFSALATRKAPTPPPKMLPVPLVTQSTHYSCGPAALLGVIAYYGNVDHNETDLMKAAKTNLSGTDIEYLTRAANEFGVKAQWGKDSTLEEIRKSLDADQPVLVEAQAWPEDTGQPRPVSYKNVWDDGHYMVVIGMDAEHIYFMDPSHLGSRGYLTIADFLDRWHDISAGNQKLYHTAVFFQGKPNPPASWLPVP